jgi:hypothetical protein
MTINARRLRSWYFILTAVPAYYVKAATFYGFHPVAAARTLAAALQARYTPQEAFIHGLLQPGSDARTDTRYISSSRMTEIQLRLNPPAWRLTMDDKSVFYGFCRAAGLPVPRLYGWFKRHRSGWSHAGGFPGGEQAWVRFFERECPDEFVVKPTLGRSGRGVRVLIRTGSGFIENGSRTITAATLYHELMTRGLYDGFVIQELIRNHPDLKALTGSNGLQTARVHTLVEEGGAVNVFYAYVRLITRDNVIDNFQRGATGNLIARIHVDTGKLHPAVTYREGLAFVPLSPDAPGAPVTEGFQLPLWEQVKELVQKAAPLFLPLRHIGWDVAMTPGGPMLMEGNFTPDAPTGGAAIHEFLAALPPEVLVRTN